MFIFASLLAIWFWSAIFNSGCHFLFTGPPESLLDWTREVDSGLSNQNNSDQVFSRKHWRLVRCQNGNSSFPCFSYLCDPWHMSFWLDFLMYFWYLCFYFANFVYVFCIVGLRIFEELLEVDYLVCRISLHVKCISKSFDASYLSFCHAAKEL